MIDLTSLGTITSGFGLREAPVEGASTNHKGVDIVLSDSNIPAVSDGVISYIGYSQSGGNMVWVTDSAGNTQKYMHLAEQASGSVGDYVTEGQTLGIMGSTGYSTGDHVHFQVENSSGTALDPISYMQSGSAGTVTTTSSGGNQKWYEAAGEYIILFVAYALLAVLAFFLFFKAFKIQLPKGG